MATAKYKVVEERPMEAMAGLIRPADAIGCASRFLGKTYSEIPRHCQCLKC